MGRDALAWGRRSVPLGAVCSHGSGVSEEEGPLRHSTVRTALPRDLRRQGGSYTHVPSMVSRGPLTGHVVWEALPRCARLNRTGALGPSDCR